LTDNYDLLNQIDSPERLKQLPAEALPLLCRQIRDFLIEHISKTGGHLASNLGAVELSVGIHRVFDCPNDPVIFDVGHQSYVHKLLTGRMGRFQTLRTLDGLSGFLRPDESRYDCFISGHASNSISAALGMARAISLSGEEGCAVCVTGDGAMTGGMAYEALNDAGRSGLPLVIVFNDNAMSIGKSVGALAERLAKIRLKPRYFRLKAKTKVTLTKLCGGDKMVLRISAVKARIRAAILKETIFDLMGFKYLGPANGHDIEQVCSLLEEAKRLHCPVVVHLKTIKGKGYLLSEKDPGQYHGVPAFNRFSGYGAYSITPSFSQTFGNCLCRLAEQDERICAVTAAMEAGTGLSDFALKFPKRFFDVGIAEAHGVAMASGMAARGRFPVYAVYSTFLQRGYDQLIHDVALPKSHVVFAVDRAGLVGADGETHQGAFDIPYLRSIPGMAIFSPSSFSELSSALSMAIYETPGPAAVRYSKGGEGEYRDDSFSKPAVMLLDGDQITLISYGIMINQTLYAARALQKRGISCAVIKLNRLDAWDGDLVEKSLRKTRKMAVIEDCVRSGCLGEAIAARMAEQRVPLDFLSLINLGDRFIKQGKVSQLQERLGLTGPFIADRIRREAFSRD